MQWQGAPLLAPGGHPRLGQDSQVLSSGAEDMLWARDSEEDSVYV